MNSSVQAVSGIFPPLVGGFIAGSLGYYSPILFAGIIIISAGLFFIFVVLKRLKNSFVV